MNDPWFRQMGMEYSSVYFSQTKQPFCDHFTRQLQQSGEQFTVRTPTCREKLLNDYGVYVGNFLIVRFLCIIGHGGSSSPFLLTGT